MHERWKKWEAIPRRLATCQTREKPNSLIIYINHVLGPPVDPNSMWDPSFSGSAETTITESHDDYLVT